MSAPLPRLDPFMVSIGEPIEDLSRIAAAQPFRSQGPTLPRDDLDLLVRAARARFRSVRATPALRDAGLMDDRGLTPDGHTVVALVHGATGRVRVESGRGRAPLTLDVYLRSGLALALATASPTSLAAAPHGDDLLTAATTVGLDILDSAAVPAHIASWVGLAPAWSLATTPTEIREDLVLARVDDPSTPAPAGADANLRHVWAQPWKLWTLRASGSETGLMVVHAGSAGSFTLQTAGEPDHVTFGAIPSAELWLRIVGSTARAAAS